MKELLISFILSGNFIATNVILAYSRVSINGQARSNPQDVAFTLSSNHFSTPKTIQLLPGEAFDHPSTPKYLDLGETSGGKVDGLTGSYRMLERFHPPAGFEHVLSHSKGTKQQFGGSNSPLVGSSTNDVVYAKPMVSMAFDYPPASPNTYSKPAPPPFSPSPQLTGSAYPGSTKGVSGPASSFDYEDGHPRPIELPGQYDSPFEPGHDELVYDHIPDDHLHLLHDEHHHELEEQHHEHQQRPPAEAMDQRLSKRPYSYYYIGRKLWYIPLYFSIYFIIYIAALVLKSIARHKINFPSSLAAASAAGNYAAARSARPGTASWTEHVSKVLEAIEAHSDGQRPSKPRRRIAG